MPNDTLDPALAREAVEYLAGCGYQPQQEKESCDMDKIKDGGPAFPHNCSRCGVPAVRLQGHQWLCAMHYRFGQMRVRAKRDGKAVPTHEQLANLFSHLNGMACPHCHRTMNWLRQYGAATQVTFQHYRSGSFGLICLSCNTRHAQMSGDDFCEIPSTHKHCSGCDTVKHFDEFATDRSKFNGKNSYCLTCHRAKQRARYHAAR